LFLGRIFLLREHVKVGFVDDFVELFDLEIVGEGFNEIDQELLIDLGL